MSAAVRAYLDSKTEVIATLKTIGAEGRVIFAAYLMQIGVLAVLGIAIGLVLGALIPLALAPVIEAQLPLPADLGVAAGPLAQAALYGVLTALIFTLWPLSRSGQIRAAALFRDEIEHSFALPGWRVALVTLGLIAALVGAAAWLSGVAWLT
ncbi:drug:proton antiporter, partial [Escherichia coli]|nr:drug:proton antiporter [Escherichia coli]